jgi:hypothetical protein
LPSSSSTSRQVPVRGELPSLVVEAVGELVADHRADGAEVHGVVHGALEERRLKDAGREVDVVLERAVCTR